MSSVRRTADRCFVCGHYASAEQSPAVGFRWLVDCHWCGRYTMRLSDQEDLVADSEASDLLPYLAAHIRQSPESSGRGFEVGSDWKDLARAHASTTISQKTRLLLEWIAKRSRIGESFEILEDEIPPFIDARNQREARFLLQHLQELQQIAVSFSTIPSDQRQPSGAGELARIQMRVRGWEAVSPTAGAGIPGVCFVAMSFGRSLDVAYEQGMVPAIEQDCGFRVVRIDRVEHNDDITDRILAGIRGAHFVVADFTGQRPGVYFEAGFAAGLGRTVIYTCRDDDFGNLHFDTRQRNHIKWTSPQDLRRHLTARIRATVTLPARLGW